MLWHFWSDPDTATEFFSTPWSRQNRNWNWKYSTLFVRGPDGIYWGTKRVKKLVAHSLLGYSIESTVYLSVCVSVINYSNNIDRPKKHFLPFSKLTNLSSEWNVGWFSRMKKCVQSINYYFLKSLNLKFVHEAWILKSKQTKTNLQKYFYSSSLNQLIYAHLLCWEPKKVRQRNQL